MITNRERVSIENYCRFAAASHTLRNHSLRVTSARSAALRQDCQLSSLTRTMRGDPTSGLPIFGLATVCADFFFMPKV